MYDYLRNHNSFKSFLLNVHVEMSTGMLIYVLYGITHSREGSVFKKRKEQEEAEAEGSALQWRHISNPVFSLNLSGKEPAVS